MFEAIAVVPRSELEVRWAKCRKQLVQTAPAAGGLLVFSRINLYYLTGTFGQGVLWLPLSGEPVLLIRKGVERARLESEIRNVVGFKSYSELPGLCRDAGHPLSKVAAAEKAGLSWQLGELLSNRLKGHEFLAGDAAIALARAVKSEWELSIMRLCGERHHRALHDVMPGLLRAGQSEREISHLAWQVFFEHGHMGHMRMGAFGEEIFLGHIAAGDSGNYPSSFNGPLGLRGEHPSLPFMGYAGRVWRPGEPLSMDIGFSLEGYCTDKTQVYWSGRKGSIPAEVASAHSFCVDIQAWICERLRPGTTPAELYGHSVREAGRLGFAEGFMGLGENKVPFLGHGIGLAIDGYPPIAKGFDAPLEVGMVLAVEPKHGIPGVGMVGVENTFEVTESGGRCLTGERYDIVCVEA